MPWPGSWLALGGGCGLGRLVVPKIAESAMTGRWALLLAVVNRRLHTDRRRGADPVGVARLVADRLAEEGCGGLAGVTHGSPGDDSTARRVPAVQDKPWQGGVKQQQAGGQAWAGRRQGRSLMRSPGR
jgi:hypothetical protein